MTKCSGRCAFPSLKARTFRQISLTRIGEISSLRVRGPKPTASTETLSISLSEPARWVCPWTHTQSGPGSRAAGMGQWQHPKLSRHGRAFQSTRHASSGWSASTQRCINPTGNENARDANAPAAAHCRGTFDHSKSASSVLQGRVRTYLETPCHLACNC